VKRTPLERRTPIRKANSKRKASRFATAFGSRERVEAIKAMPCCVCGSRPSENAHIRSRAAGGTWQDIVPLCRAHHREQHDIGLATFQERHAINLRLIADQIGGTL
jgi:hypothetical protein